MSCLLALIIWPDLLLNVLQIGDLALRMRVRQVGLLTPFDRIIVSFLSKSDPLRQRSVLLLVLSQLLLDSESLVGLKKIG